MNTETAPLQQEEYDPFTQQRKELQEIEEIAKNGNLSQALKALELCAHSLKKVILELSPQKRSMNRPLSLKLNNDTKLDYIELKSTILYEIGDFDDAEKGFKTLIDEGPEQRKPYFYKDYADCLRKRLAYEESIDFYTKAYEGFKTSITIDVLDRRTLLGAVLNNRGLSYLELRQYENAQKDFKEASENEKSRPRALYICNEGQANYLIGDREAALKCFQEAIDILKVSLNTLSEDREQFYNYLRQDQARYIKTRFADFIKELDQLEQIKLKIPDEIIVAREKQYVTEVVKEINAPTDKEGNAQDKEKEKEWEQFVKILDSKQKLELIQDNSLLYQYYDGFLYTLSQGYVVATVVNSGQLTVDAGGNSTVTAVSTLVSLIPIVGEQVSAGINKISEFVNDAQIRKAAVNVCSFATTVTEFESMAQEAAIDVILQKKTEIENLQPETYLLPSWMEKFQQVIEKLNANIYGERYQTSMQKLGYQTASSLIARFIASGQVYDNQPPICILPKQKKSKLLDISLALLNENIDDSNKKFEPVIAEIPKSQGEPPNCCQMF